MECCICYKQKSKQGKGYESFVKCITETAAVNLQNHALATNDNPRLLASVSGIDWQEIIPQELKYHKSCYINITGEKKAKTNIRGRSN